MAAKTRKGIRNGPFAFLVIYQALLLLSLPFYFYFAPPSKGIVITTVVLLYLTGLSITGGYHRYFAHKTFKANKFLEFILVFLGTMTAQGSILRWSFDHRIHHAHVDTDEDPYSIKKGFWYAHFLWINDTPREIDPKVVPDLTRNKLIMFQHNYYPWLMVAANAIPFFFFGWLFGDYVGAFFMVVWLRMFLLHHFTWFINSLAHTWGDKPFCTEQSAVDNYIISLLTFGEGYHNYHHTYANDYRNGIRWFHYDPTKWIIWALNKLGLASNLRRMDPFTVKKKMVLERKSLLLDHLKQLWYVKRDEMEQKVSEISESIVENISRFKQLQDSYLQMKREKRREKIDEIRSELKVLKRRIKDDWRKWKLLSSTILRLNQAEALQN